MDATRRERLAALGIELLALRSELSAAADVDATPPESGEARAARAAARLSVRGIDWPSGAPLPRAVIAALGLRPEEVSAEPSTGRPVLAFGAGTDADAAVLAPALAELRDAARKRALWPALRRLRRQLAGERT